jgi:hypothetical protein
MLNWDLGILEEEPVQLLVNSMLDSLHLLGDDREHLQLNSVELVEATPGAAAGETLEELTHGLVVETVRAIEHDTLTGEGLGKILYCLRLAGTGWSLWCSTIVQVNSSA